METPQLGHLGDRSSTGRKQFQHLKTVFDHDLISSERIHAPPIIAAVVPATSQKSLFLLAIIKDGNSFHIKRLLNP